MGSSGRPGFLDPLVAAYTWLDQHAGWIFLLGLGLVMYLQWKNWRRDKALLERIKNAPPPPSLEDWPTYPLVSVLAAAWNEAEHIENHIQSFLDLSYPKKELVLVAGGEDGTLDLANPFAAETIHILEQLPGEGKQNSLKRGFEVTSGEIIYLTDADCLLDDQSFERVVWPVLTGEEEAATGTSKPFPEEISKPFIFAQAGSQIYNAFHTPEYAPGLLGRNCAISRDVLVKSEGLEKPAPTGTDYVLAKALDRIGTCIRQVPESLIASEYPSRIPDYVRQQHRFLWNVWYYGRRNQSSSESISVLLNAMMGLLMILLPILGIFSPIILSIWGLLFTFGGFSRVRYNRFTKQLLEIKLNSIAWWSIPVFLLLDFLVWAGALPVLMKKDKAW